MLLWNLVNFLKLSSKFKTQVNVFNFLTDNLSGPFIEIIIVVVRSTCRYLGKADSNDSYPLALNSQFFDQFCKHYYSLFGWIRNPNYCFQLIVWCTQAFMAYSVWKLNSWPTAPEANALATKKKGSFKTKVSICFNISAKKQF